jgi:hypothetical protein
MDFTDFVLFLNNTKYPSVNYKNAKYCPPPTKLTGDPAAIIGQGANNSRAEGYHMTNYIIGHTQKIYK